MSYFSVREAAQSLGLSVPTVRRWIRKGSLRARLSHGPFGEQWEIPSEEIRRVGGAGEDAASPWEQRCHELEEQAQRLARQLDPLRRQLSERDRQLAQALEQCRDLEARGQRLEQMARKISAEKEQLAAALENITAHNEHLATELGQAQNVPSVERLGFFARLRRWLRSSE